MKTIIAFLAIVLTLNVFAAPSAQKLSSQQAEARAAAWIKGLGEKGLVIDEERGPKEAGFAGRAIAGSENSMFVISDSKYSITLGFSGAVDESTALETLREKFSYIALDKVPTPGLEIAGWEIKPRTPTSSLRKASGAVEILAAGDGRISIRVKTHFFALSGRDPSVLVPADAASPAGSYFQIRQRFELDLTLSSPFKMGK